MPCTCIFHLFKFKDALVFLVTIWWQMLNFVFLCPKHRFQLNFRTARTHFSSIMTLNNWKMIAETRSYICRWRSCFRRRRRLLKLSLPNVSRDEVTVPSGPVIISVKCQLCIIYWRRQSKGLQNFACYYEIWGVLYWKMHLCVPRFGNIKNSNQRQRQYHKIIWLLERGNIIVLHDCAARI